MEKAIMMNINRISAVNDFRIDETLPASPFRCQTGTTISRQALQTGSSAISLMSDSVNAAVLGTVNRLLCATEYQISDALTGMGVDCRYSDIRNRMFRMAGAGLLEHYQYRCDCHTYTHSFFCLGDAGRKYIRSYGRRLFDNPYQPTEDPARILKLLAVNQFLTKTRYPVDKARIGVKIQAEDSNTCAFRPQAILEKDGRSLFLEGVRREKNWADGLLTKLERAESVLREKAKIHFPVHNPCMILIGEDTAHSREMMQMLEKKRYSFGLWYTSDDMVYCNPGNCLYEITGGFRSRIREGIDLWQQILGVRD